MYWLRQRIHPTWHVTTLCFGMVIGIAWARLWQGDVMTLVFGGGLLTLLTCMTYRRIMVVAALVGGICFGLARGSDGQQAQAIYRDLYRTHVVVTGVVADDIDITTRGSVHARLRDIQLDGHALPGTVFATLSGQVAEAKRSDVVTVDGTLSEGFGNFPASLMGKVTRVSREEGVDVARDIRDGFADRIRQVLPEPQASLGIGYLLGQKNALPADLDAALKATALTHIVVASGYNLTILVRLGRRLFQRISKYLSVLVGGSLIVGFIAMTGLSPSMTRAGLIAGLALWAGYVGRRFHPVTLLAVAAAVTAGINPSYVWGDLGWLLSFAAFAGVMIIAPIINAYFFGENVPFIGQLLIETLSAQVATLPIMIVAFHQFSVIGLLANMLVLPLVPLAMLGIAIAGACTLWAPASVAVIIALPAKAILSFQTTVITWCADIPWALAKPEWGIWHVLGHVGIVTTLLWYMKWQTRMKLYTTSIVE